MLRQYQRVTGTTTEFLDWRDLFDSLSMRFENDSERVFFFKEFLQAFYLTSSESGSIPRQKFYNDTNLPRSAIDWGEWRELRRGTT